MNKESKGYKKMIKISVFILIGMIIYAEAVYCGQVLGSQYNTVSIRLDESDAITSKDISQALKNEVKKKKEIPDITLWRSDKKSEIYSEEIYKDDYLNDEYVKNKEEYIKKEKVQLYKTYGDCDKVYPMELRYGSFLLKDDIKGCIIDKDTCYKLLGTENGIGSSILLEGKTYYIRGVADIEEPSVIIESDDENYKFNNIELTYSDDEYGKEMSYKFMSENGLGEEYVVFDCEFYGKIAKKAAKIPAWILMFFLLVKALKILKYSCENLAANNKYKSKIQFIGIILFSLIIVISSLYVAEFELYYPVRMIPSKWSDFQFWEDKIKEIKILFHEFVYVIPYPRDVSMIEYFKTSIFCSALSCLNAAVLFKHRTIICKWLKDDEIGLIKLFIIILLISFIAIMFINRKNACFVLPRFYPGILFIYFFAGMFFEKIEMSMCKFV